MAIQKEAGYGKSTKCNIKNDMTWRLGGKHDMVNEIERGRQ